MVYPEKKLCFQKWKGCALTHLGCAFRTFPEEAKSPTLEGGLY